MKFVFKAKTEAGQDRSGVVEALSRDAAIQVLQNNGLTPFSVQEEGHDVALVRDLSKLWEGVSQKELMVMFRQLATLISARVPMVSALDTLADQASNRYLRIILKEIEDDVEDPQGLAERIRTLSTELSLTGRVIVAEEGINGTLEGTLENTEDFVKQFFRDERFSDVQVKRSAGEGNSFPRLKVKVRKEIVGTGFTEEEANPRVKTAPKISPEELRSWYEKGEDFVVVDMRNDYEFASGRLQCR
jgi:hypothetical protein